jgi:hypothetical protein
MQQQSRHVALAARLERIKQRTDDLARAQGAESLTSRALADHIKRDVDAVGRDLKRPRP